MRMTRLVWVVCLVVIGVWTCQIAAGGELHDAVHEGDTKKVERLLDADPELIDDRDKKGRTALYVAVTSDEEAIIRLLIERGADVNAKNRSGDSPIHRTVNRRLQHLAPILLENGAEVDLRTACGLGLMDRVKELVKARPDLVNERDVSAWTPMYWAAWGGQTEAAEYLIAHGGQAKVSDRIGNTPLHWAIGTGYDNEKLVEALLKGGADPNAANREGDTPLHEAAPAGENRTVKVLVEHGANLNARNKEGRTPAWQAATHRDDTLKLLLRLGAEVDIFLAVRLDMQDGVRKLVAQKPEAVHERDGLNRTPLFWAAENGHEKMTGFLIEKGADVNARDNKGQTPLFRAVDGWRGRKIVSLLIDNGADLNASDARGRTPLFLAAASGHKDMVVLLIAHGADAKVKDKKGKGLLGQTEAPEIRELLLKHGATR